METSRYHLSSSDCLYTHMMTSSQVEHWPANFNVQILSQRPLIQEVHDWIEANTPPMCVFMADRLPDSAAHTANATQFGAITSALLQNQFVSLLATSFPYGTRT